MHSDEKNISPIYRNGSGIFSQTQSKIWNRWMRMSKSTPAKIIPVPVYILACMQVAKMCYFPQDAFRTALNLWKLWMAHLEFESHIAYTKLRKVVNLRILSQHQIDIGVYIYKYNIIHAWIFRIYTQTTLIPNPCKRQKSVEWKNCSPIRRHNHREKRVE